MSLHANTFRFTPLIDRAQRESQNNHKSILLWFTGLSGSGKSTLAHAVEKRLHAMNCRTFVLDGDNVRQGLCKDLGFTEHDRIENIRRIAELGRLFLDAGLITLTAFISPFRADRDRARTLFAPGDFVEIYCRCTLDVCEERDVKGLYRRARAGEIPHFTGISSPYEEPLEPDLLIDTDKLSVDACVDLILELLARRQLLLKPIED